MGERLVTAATFEIPEDAYAARLRLTAEGIESVVTEASVGGWLWHLWPATGGVKLQVIDSQLTKARQILFPEKTAAADSASQPPPWYCGNCCELVDADFEVCWSCSSPREDVETAPPQELENAAASQAASKEISEEAAGQDARIRRAWRAAVIGIFVFPPLLNLYSIWLLVDVFRSPFKFERDAAARVYGAIAFDVLAFGIAILLAVTTFD